MRIPTSNSSPNPLPDVFAVKGNLLLAFEVKSSWEDRVKVRSLQIRKLFEFVSLFPMTGVPAVAVKFKKIGRWKFLRVKGLTDIVVTLEGTQYLEELLTPGVESLEKVEKFREQEKALADF